MNNNHQRNGSNQRNGSHEHNGDAVCRAIVFAVASFVVMRLCSMLKEIVRRAE